MKPMALEQVLSERDSEDEVDDDVADLEDRRVFLALVVSTVLVFYFYNIYFTFVRINFAFTEVFSGVEMH